jgi:hypothetical protein
MNVSIDTLCMLVWAHVYCNLLQRLLQRLLSLYGEGRLRLLAVPVLALSVHSHIAGGWAVWNSINELPLRHMLPLRLFYCATELVVTLGAYAYYTASV